MSSSAAASRVRGVARERAVTFRVPAAPLRVRGTKFEYELGFVILKGHSRGARSPVRLRAQPSRAGVRPRECVESRAGARPRGCVESRAGARPRECVESRAGAAAPLRVRGTKFEYELGFVILKGALPAARAPVRQRERG